MLLWCKRNGNDVALGVARLQGNERALQFSGRNVCHGNVFAPPVWAMSTLNFE